MFKKMLALFLATVIVASLGGAASARAVQPESNKMAVRVENEIMPMYNYVSSLSTSLSITDGTAVCSVIVQGYSTLATRIEVKLTLQKKVLFWWSDVESWSYSADDSLVVFEKKASVGGGTYRVKSEAKVFSGTSSETVTGYSPEKKN